MHRMRYYNRAGNLTEALQPRDMWRIAITSRKLRLLRWQVCMEACLHLLRLALVLQPCNVHGLPKGSCSGCDPAGHLPQGSGVLCWLLIQVHVCPLLAAFNLLRSWRG